MKFVHEFVTNATKYMKLNMKDLNNINVIVVMTANVNRISILFTTNCTTNLKHLSNRKKRINLVRCQTTMKKALMKTKTKKKKEKDKD